MDKRVILFLIGILAGAFVVHLLAEVLSLMFSMTLGAVGFAYLAYLLFKNNWLKRPFRYKHIWQREDFDPNNLYVDARGRMKYREKS